MKEYTDRDVKRSQLLRAVGHGDMCVSTNPSPAELARGFCKVDPNSVKVDRPDNDRPLTWVSPTNLRKGENFSGF